MHLNGRMIRKRPANSLVFKLNNAVKVEIDSLPAYDPYATAVCPKCGYRWKYKGREIGMKCSQCGWLEIDKAYMKAYRQTPKYKAYQKRRYQLKKAGKQ